MIAKPHHKGLLAALALAGCLLTPSLATAQAQFDGKTFQDWTLRCGTIAGTQEERCLMEQFVFSDPEKQKIALRVRVLSVPGTKEPGMQLLFPLGVLLQAGLSLQVGEAEAKKYPITVCLPEGCIAEILLEEGLLGAMRAGTEATVVLQNIRHQNVKAGSFSLKGFTAALKALQEANPATTN